MFTRLLFYLIQWTWGLPQNLAGFFVWIIEKCWGSGKSEVYKNTVVTHWKKDKSLSLGMFLFLGYGAGERLLKHEYGHSIQSLILGPVYLMVIGIPSYLWCNVPVCGKKWREGKVSYYSVWHERWADRCGYV